VRRLGAPLRLVVARVRRRPARWTLPALGIGLAAAFAVAVAAESVVAGDQSARSALAAVSPRDRSVRVTWQGVVTPGVARRARLLLRGLGLDGPTEVTLLNPVRLDGIVVRPAAIAPLSRWIDPAQARGLGRCQADSCPMLLAGGRHVPSRLRAYGVRLQVVGAVPLRSQVPLGFSPADAADQPVLLGGDVAGLDALSGLSGVYRTHSWLANLAVARLHSWQLASFEARLDRAQAGLLAMDSQFSLSAPFGGLDDARAQAATARRRLLLTGGSAIAGLVLFILLAGGALRRDQLAELERLRNAGAREGQCTLFVVAESGWLCAVALTLGAGLGMAAAAVLAHTAGEPVGAVLSQGLITPAGGVAVVAGWLAATTLVSASVLARDARIVDVLAIAAAAALVFGLSLNAGDDEALGVLLAPLCCLAAGVLTYRATAGLLRAGEHLVRRGPVLVRLALVSLARAPALPSLAVAFIAVSVGLGGFALAYRATLLRGAADQAANRVPLDATVSASQNFTTPLQDAPLARWRALASGGTVAPVRRTDANYTFGDGTVTVPALGIPADTLTRIHSWRASDGSASLPTLARRLRPAGRVRVAGPALPAGTRWLSVGVVSPALAVTVMADLRDPHGAITQVSLRAAGAGPGRRRARVPAGGWELQALELDESTGLALTNGHQNGENPAAASQFQAHVVLGPVQALPRRGGTQTTVGLGAWRAVGAAVRLRSGNRGSAVVVSFATTGEPGLVRPAQPSDSRPVPVLVDPQAAAAAGPGGRIAMTVDGLPVLVRVIGTLRRFPTLPADDAGFVVADEATLAAALDGQLPGQGRPDELWITTAHPARLRAALHQPPLRQLGFTFRADVEHALRTAPVAAGALGTLIGAAVLSAPLSVLGLLAALLGGARDERIERDLEAQGVGPRARRAELRMRLALASVLGVLVGLGLAVLLTRLAVTSVRAAGGGESPHPPLVSVAPWPQLGAGAIGAIVVLILAGLLATRSLIPKSRASRPAPTLIGDTDGALGDGVVQ
jgi:hypothetical protein